VGQVKRACVGVDGRRVGSGPELPEPRALFAAAPQPSAPQPPEPHPSPLRHAPPILRFTLAVLDALDVQAIARTIASAFVEPFGCLAAIVRGGEPGEVLAHAGVLVDPSPAAANGPGPVRLVFRVGSGGATIEAWVEAGPDLPIVRQQLLDLVAVVRRAWTHAERLALAERDATSDALTGVHNRRGVEDWLEQALLRSRHTGRPLAVMLVDLDHFKRVNDSLGHIAGDAVLQHATACLQEQVRKDDRICRWGGDEFLVVLDGADAATATRVAERLRQAFAAAPEARACTMSIGVADTASLPPEVPYTARALVERADAAAYAAKAAGRDRVCAAAPVAIADE
jgi:diguanylate cyclase (GGDEF)-like protein